MKQTVRMGLWVALAVAGGTSCTSTFDVRSRMPVPFLSPLSLHKDKPFVIAVGDRPLGWGYYSHPSLYRVSTNRLLVLYYTIGDVGGAADHFFTLNDDGSVTPPHAVPGPAYSEDNGQTWAVGTPPWLVEPGPMEDQEFFIRARIPHPEPQFYSFTRRSDGTSIGFTPRVLQFPGTNGLVFLGAATTYDQRGEVTGGFTVRYNLPIKYWKYSEVLRIQPHGLELPDGSLLSVGYTPCLPQYKKYSRTGYVSLALRSEDGGRTFHVLSIIATDRDAPWGRDGPCEPAVEQLAGGELLVMMRTGSGGSGDAVKSSTPLLRAWSSDGGSTWPKKAGAFPGVMPRLLQMSNGVLACASGRPGSFVRFSLDGGRSWPRGIQVVGEEEKTSSYVDMLEVAPGRLLVVYDKWGALGAGGVGRGDVAEVNAVLGTFLDAELQADSSPVAAQQAEHEP